METKPDNIRTISRSHYGASMNARYMTQWGKKIARRVGQLIDNGMYPILCYRGMSGISAANAIAYNMPPKHDEQYAMVYVRKKEEQSHGAPIEYTTINPNNKKVVWIFCDDFICTGTSLLETLKSVSERFGVVPLDRVLYALSLGEEKVKLASALIYKLHDAITNGCEVTVTEKVTKEYSKFVKSMERREKRRQKAIKKSYANLIEFIKASR